MLLYNKKIPLIHTHIAKSCKEWLGNNIKQKCCYITPTIVFAQKSTIKYKHISQNSICVNKIM